MFRELQGLEKRKRFKVKKVQLEFLQFENYKKGQFFSRCKQIRICQGLEKMGGKKRFVIAYVNYPFILLEFHNSMVDFNLSFDI